jgi:hypothetical protein
MKTRMRGILAASFIGGCAVGYGMLFVYPALMLSAYLLEHVMRLSGVALWVVYYVSWGLLGVACWGLGSWARRIVVRDQ